MQEGDPEDGTMSEDCLFLNVFARNDPIAYRIEPLLLEADAEGDNSRPREFSDERGERRFLDVDAIVTLGIDFGALGLDPHAAPLVAPALAPLPPRGLRRRGCWRGSRCRRSGRPRPRRRPRPRLLGRSQKRNSQ